MSKDVKTLALRLEPAQHARLVMLARLTETTVADLIRAAIDTQLTALAADPDVAAKAEAASAAIQADAAEQQAALQGLFGSPKSRRTRQG